MTDHLPVSYGDLACPSLVLSAAAVRRIPRLSKTKKKNHPEAFSRCRRRPRVKTLLYNFRSTRVTPPVTKFCRSTNTRNTNKKTKLLVRWSQCTREGNEIRTLLMTVWDSTAPRAHIHGHDVAIPKDSLLCKYIEHIH